MSEKPKTEAGAVTWVDLTAPAAEQVRDFYAAVVGWKHDAVGMGDYDDFVMTTPDTGTPVGGICHARGSNADLPPQWLMYINVADLDQSMQSCRDLGGKIVVGPKTMGGHGRYCVIQDPAGAVAALFEPEVPE